MIRQAPRRQERTARGTQQNGVWGRTRRGSQRVRRPGMFAPFITSGRDEYHLLSGRSLRWWRKIDAPTAAAGAWRGIPAGRAGLQGTRWGLTGLAVLFFCLVGTGGPDEHLPSTARIHRWARRRGGLAARGARTAGECRAGLFAAKATPTSLTGTVDDWAPRGRRGRHAKKERAVKARNHSWIA
jgi:hypothetical protein